MNALPPRAFLVKGPDSRSTILEVSCPSSTQLAVVILEVWDREPGPHTANLLASQARSRQRAMTSERRAACKVKFQCLPQDSSPLGPKDKPHGIPMERDGIVLSSSFDAKCPVPVMSR